ncbi:hypothetical protein ACHHYP_11178 [Achlya hypogyna]|uniref:Endonuclease/exonuclease/phosphatase domain-containing protein n=1 Tax=Achlya hypogyna TaxID=1202772 RepID=A0A1V9YJN9_ACHHY|nr:hypothetical protein ACHHYP_11178 [Achlya hypogyna]
MRGVSTAALTEARWALKKTPFTIFTRPDYSRFMLRQDGTTEDLPPLTVAADSAAFPFDPPSWVHAAAHARPTDPTQLRVVTWNVWFDRLAQAQRYEALFAQVLALAADVVCLQEVTPQFLAAVEHSVLLQAVYTHSPAPVYPYGCLILARRTLEPAFDHVPLPSRMDRVLIVCRVIGGAVGTVHLESLNSPIVRDEQLRVCEAALAPFTNAILCGDFNFDDTQAWGSWHRPSNAPLENDVLATVLHAYVDVWTYLRPHDRGATFDGGNNPRCIADPLEVMRYDRIMLKRGAWTPGSIALLGEAPLDPTGMKVSDHYGLALDCIVNHGSHHETTDL